MLDGGKLKFLRCYHEKSQVEMAEWCDISERYVGMIEHNQYNPSDEVYKAWLDCCYGIGKPLAKRENKKGVVKSETKGNTVKKKATSTKKQS